MKNNHLKSLVPENSWSILSELTTEFPGTIRVSRPRKTKLGDFKVNPNTKITSISINSDLNKNQFLVTLVHELAHYKTWKEYKWKVQPHGTEWKKNYSQLLSLFLDKNIFSLEIENALKKHSRSPKSSSCLDANLFKTLNSHESSQNDIYVSDLPIGSVFSYGEKGQFIVKQKLRKRIKCLHTQSKRLYLFQPIVKVSR